MINWYPGHMAKAMREIEENLRIVDVVLYVLDARAPYSCINPNFENMLGRTPVIYALNKADLGESTRVKQWCEYFSVQNRRALTLNATASRTLF